MKKDYKELELEVIHFDAEDVITTSADNCPRDTAVVTCPNNNIPGTNNP